MKRFRLAVLVIATLLATGGLYTYAEQLDDEHEALVADRVEVVKASRSLDAGAVLTKDRLTTERVPRKFLPPNPLLESELHIYLGTPLATNVEEGALLLTTDFNASALPGPSSASSGEFDANGRLVVKTANVTLQADDPAAVAIDFGRRVEGAGGFVVTSTVQQKGTESSAELTARVPTARYDATLDALRKNGELLNEQLTGTDVTNKWIDLDAELRAERDLEKRIRPFLEEATSLDQILKVHEQVKRIQMNADMVEGRRDALRSSEAMSTVKLTVYATPPAEPTVDRLAPIKRAFSDSGDVVVSSVAAMVRVFAWLVPILFMFGPIAIVSLLVWRRFGAASARVG